MTWKSSNESTLGARVDKKISLKFKGEACGFVCSLSVRVASNCLCDSKLRNEQGKGGAAGVPQVHMLLYRGDRKR